jgi:hypothetical protein
MPDEPLSRMVDEFRAIIASSSLDEAAGGARRRREALLTGSDFAGELLMEKCGRRDRATRGS